MNIETAFAEFCSHQDINLERISSVLPYDDSTLFCSNGRQKYKNFFENPAFRGLTLANIQTCLILSETFDPFLFHSLGFYSFRQRTLEEAVRFWMNFLMSLGELPDYISIHPEAPSWKEAFQHYHAIEIREDENCYWSDGQIGSYEIHFYLQNELIGRILHPKNSCIDSFFQLEILEKLINGVKSETKVESFSKIAQQLIQERVKVSHEKQGLVLAQVLQFLHREGVSIDAYTEKAQASASSRRQESSKDEQRRETRSSPSPTDSSVCTEIYHDCTRNPSAPSSLSALESG